MFYSYREFLLESEKVELEKDLREYTLTHVNEGIFQIKSKDFYKEVNVLPFKNETVEKLEKSFESLLKSIDSLDPRELFSSIKKAELIDYHFGNVFTGPLELKNVSNLALSLQRDQLESLATSEERFLINDFQTLPKDTKEEILEILRERAEVLACVIEALFYYIRSVDKENYYEGMDSREIAKTYEEQIEKSSKEVSFSFEGPFSDVQRNSFSLDSRSAFWKCSKDGKEFWITGTVSPKELYAEENIGGTKGLKLSIVSEKDMLPKGDYAFFDTRELTSRVEMFNKKILSTK